MQPLRLLLVEDEERLAGNLRQGLSEEGIALDWVKSAEEAEAILARKSYDLMVLDIGLPGKSGVDFLRERRRGGDSTPVLFLTARGSIDDRVSGLESGGDDYLVKPFAFAELLARIHALSRRRPAVQTAVLRVGDLEFDAVKRRARRADKTIALSPKEAMLLELLMRRVGEVVTRDMIAETVWDSGYNVFTNLIEVFVNRLRQKIDADPKNSMIATVRGVGYSMKRA
ncbi:MAG TPA: response regulator transcription factor [Candidatus Binataceae bacterium]|nr:response regulator transcription factor [Candidatus Binataceae bacterium]